MGQIRGTKIYLEEIDRTIEIEYYNDIENIDEEMSMLLVEFVEKMKGYPIIDIKVEKIDDEQ